MRPDKTKYFTIIWETPFHWEHNFISVMLGESVKSIWKFFNMKVVLHSIVIENLIYLSQSSKYVLHLTLNVLMSNQGQACSQHPVEYRVFERVRGKWNEYLIPAELLIEFTWTKIHLV